MTKISEHVYVDVPLERIPKLAEAYLESLPYSEREGAHTVLRGWVANVVVECEVLLKLSPLGHSANREVLEIAWRPIGEGPYPSFAGTLVAEALNAVSCRLELNGEYRPPGGILGAAFDAVLGRRIAGESARDLLATFKNAFEGARPAPNPAVAPAVAVLPAR